MGSACKAGAQSGFGTGQADSSDEPFSEAAEKETEADPAAAYEKEAAGKASFEGAYCGALKAYEDLNTTADSYTGSGHKKYLLWTDEDEKVTVVTYRQGTGESYYSEKLGTQTEVTTTVTRIINH